MSSNSGYDTLKSGTPSGVNSSTAATGSSTTSGLTGSSATHTAGSGTGTGLGSSTGTDTSSSATGQSAISKATGAVKDFMSRSGHHDTTVHEKVNPGVVHENITPTQHENVTTAIDKEIHQDHHHTSVQPVKDTKVLPEQHSHNLVGVEKREFEHGDPRDAEARIAKEHSKFKDERVVGSTEHTHSVAPVVAGEHIHHHVHETIQPVVQRDVVQPSVVHTTVPIHEVHHNAAQHHSTSALPAVSMQDFKKQGGTLGGREERTDAFEGEPRSVGGALSSSAKGYESGATGTTGHHTHHGHHGQGHTGTTGTTGLTGTSGSTGSTTGVAGTSSTTGHHTGTTGHHTGTTGTTGTTGSASMGAKLNPKIDADGDGKRGVMD